MGKHLSPSTRTVLSRNTPVTLSQANQLRSGGAAGLREAGGSTSPCLFTHVDFHQAAEGLFLFSEPSGYSGCLRVWAPGTPHNDRFQTHCLQPQTGNQGALDAQPLPSPAIHQQPRRSEAPPSNRCQPGPLKEPHSRAELHTRGGNSSFPGRGCSGQRVLRAPTVGIVLCPHP